MSLDSETKIALAEELEDVAMELVGISQLSPSQQEITAESILTSVLSETERLNDISELYDYPELYQVTLWAHKNIRKLKSKPDLFLQQNEEGFFYTWLDLLSALLREHDADLLSELKDSLSHENWLTAIQPQDLKTLLNSLASDSNKEANDDVATDNKTIDTAHEQTDELPSTETSSSYQLTWDDDVHPELLEAFFIETPDLVIDVADHIRQISSSKADQETHQSAARIAHTIKGSSAVVGIEPVAKLAHKLEDILEYSVDNPLPPEVSELLIESADCLESMFDSLQTQSPAPQEYPQLLEALSQWEQKFSSGYIYEDVINEQETPEQINTKSSDKKENDEEQTSTKSSYPLAWNKDVHPELLEAYMSETPAHVIELSQLLRRIGKEKVSSDDYKKASRLSHTIKGTSAVVGITAVADFAQQLEEIFDYATEKPLPEKLSPLFLESADLIESLYDSLLSEGVPPQEYPKLYKKLCEWEQYISEPLSDHNQDSEQKKTHADKAKNTQIEDKDSSQNPVVEKKQVKDKQTEEETEIEDSFSSFDIKFPPLQEILNVAPPIVKTPAPEPKRANINETTLRIPISLIEKLLNFSSELITSNTQLAEQVDTLLADRKDINERNERVRSMLDELEWTINQQAASGSKSMRSISINDKKNSGLDSLEMDSYNELHSITGLLSESINDDREMSVSLIQQLNALKGQLHNQKRINKELNNTVLNMRMEPIKILSPRLERIVRETCRRTGKKAELEIIGEELSIDTDVIKGLVDPLLHLLRNAVDHGIESPEDRKKLGKNEVGKIQLKFTQQGDQVILSLKDDGAGIDEENIYNVAIKKGLVKKKSKLSKNEKLRLILQAGFSTKETVSDISGRGVGMDVVNTSIQNMSGNINISSNKNKGSEIKLQVPLTLSAANVLLVKLSDNTVAIPNSSIHQVYYLTQDNLISKDKKLFINYQEQQIPLLSLSSLLSWAKTPFSSETNKSVIIVEHQNKYFALYVDEILKPQEITLKTLKPWMNNVKGVNGVCLLANGVVSPVLNILDLLHSFDESFVTPINTDKNNEQAESSNNILVVDDSLSNRKALSLMLQALDYNVSTAIDGLDALQKIGNQSYQLIITDLEMPNMDGLEFVDSLRSWSETRQLPIVMVTSRSTEKHQTLAKEAGVDVYLTKPVDSATLKSTVEQLLFQKTATNNNLKSIHGS